MERISPFRPSQPSRPSRSGRLTTTMHTSKPTASQLQYHKHPLDTPFNFACIVYRHKTWAGLHPASLDHLCAPLQSSMFTLPATEPSLIPEKSRWRFRHKPQSSNRPKHRPSTFGPRVTTVLLFRANDTRSASTRRVSTRRSPDRWLGATTFPHAAKALECSAILHFSQDRNDRQLRVQMTPLTAQVSLTASTATIPFSSRTPQPSSLHPSKV